MRAVAKALENSVMSRVFNWLREEEPFLMAFIECWSQHFPRSGLNAREVFNTPWKLEVFSGKVRFDTLIPPPANEFTVPLMWKSRDLAASSKSFSDSALLSFDCWTMTICCWPLDEGNTPLVGIAEDDIVL